ncbi:DedA family protein [Candidatus Woesebacteria bacterium]|nr:DedA family protein [Candidatus Woesebacteria bacterium]
MGKISEVIVQLLTKIIETNGLTAIFVLMALESALIPIPSEITMPFGGFLAGRGIFNFWVVVFIGASGNLAGSLLAYWLGYTKGEGWVLFAIKKWGKWILIREEEYFKAKEMFKKYGQGISFGSRLLPVIRTFISLPAGISKMDIRQFSIFTFLGSFIWSAVLAWFGLKLGQNWNALEPYFRKFQVVIVLLFVLAIGIYIKKHLPNKNNSAKKF